MKQIIFLIFLLSLFCQCRSDSNTSKKTGSPFKNTPPKVADQEKRKQCRQIGSGTCDSDCKEICDDFFSGSEEEVCNTFTSSLVDEFENIIEQTKDGKTKSLDQEALNCMLELDNKEFAEAIDSMSSKEVKDFLKQITRDEDLAQIFLEEDFDLRIIDTLLEESSGSNNLLNILTEQVDGDKTFVWLSADKSKHAFRWLEDYVEAFCEEEVDDATSSINCPGFSKIENLGAYCKALLQLSDDNLKSFLSQADFFEDQYKEQIQEAGYEYKITNQDYIWDTKLKGDFKDFCELEVAITEGERKLRSENTQDRYFNSNVCKQNLKPAGFYDADASGSIDSADTTRIWALKDCASNPPYACITTSSNPDYFTGYMDNEYVWEYGNVYGNTRNAFGAERLNGIGQSFWYLNADKEIIIPFLEQEFSIKIRRRYLLAPNDPPQDPKAQKVRRASFLYYTPPLPQGQTSHPDYTSCTRDAGDRDTCLYFYCLVDYRLNSAGDTVTTCNVLKCALGG